MNSESGNMTTGGQEAPAIDQLSKKKLIWDLSAARADVFLKYSASAFVIAFSLGAMLIFVYFFRHNFNPGGISASDTVSMALASAAFFLVVAIVLLLASKVTYSAAWALTGLISWSLDRLRRWRDDRVPPTADGGIDVVALNKNLNGSILLEWKSTSKFWLALSSILLALTVYVMANAPIAILMSFFCSSSRRALAEFRL